MIALPTSAVKGSTVDLPVSVLRIQLYFFSQWMFLNSSPHISDARIPNLTAINTIA